MSEQTIELDCPPGYPRPGDLIDGVLKDTGIEVKDEPSKTFGNWTWDFSHIPEEAWKKTNPIIKERVTALYNQGIIRYGSW